MATSEYKASIIGQYDLIKIKKTSQSDDCLGDRIS